MVSMQRAMLTLMLLLAAAEDSPADLDARARRAFEIGDYPSSERDLRRLIERSPPGSTARAGCLLRLATVLSFEDARDEAAAAVDSALRIADGPDARRVAYGVFLRAQDYGRALLHAEAVLRAVPDDAPARFARGLALSRLGRHQEALADLDRGLGDPRTRRAARFESALALGKLGRPAEALERLAAILEDDPLDREACFQAAQQLLRLPGRAGLRTAAHLLRYFQELERLAGPSSRDHHLAAAGRPVEAAIERAARHERLGALDAALKECAWARAIDAGDAGLSLHLAGFWQRRGLLLEAEAELERAASAAGEDGEAGASAFAGPRASLEASRRELAAPPASPLAAARRRLADARWLDAAAPLEELLAAARAAGETGLADDAARLLAVRSERPLAAWRHLAERSQDPALLAQRLHYLARLAAAEPGDRRWRDAADACRRELLGAKP
jgi:tetratricopeptide (TPR) repeat protein